MEEILHHQKDGWNPINNGINHLSTGAGFRNHPQYVPYIFPIKHHFLHLPPSNMLGASRLYNPLHDAQPHAPRAAAAGPRVAFFQDLGDAQAATCHGVGWWFLQVKLEQWLQTNKNSEWYL